MIAGRRRHEEGSALFIAVLMLVMMGFMGVAALDSVSRDREIAGVQNRSRNAFYAAEAGVAEARAIVASPAVDDRGDTPAFATQGAPMNLGDAGLYDREMTNLPNSYGDPAFAAPIRYWKQKVWANGGNLQPNSQQLWETFWHINVIGESPDGSRSRVEAVAIKLMGNGS